jgi:hypothetical protein
VHDVPSGLISINVSFAGTQIYEEVDDLCSKTTCPIKTGPLDITYVQDLPPIAPPVSCLGRILCLDAHAAMYVSYYKQHGWHRAELTCKHA